MYKEFKNSSKGKLHFHEVQLFEINTIKKAIKACLSIILIEN